MANAVYPAYRQAALSGAAPDLTTAAVKLVLVDLADYAYSAAHDFLDDVPAAARAATSPALTGRTVAGGVFDAADPTLTAVSGDPLEAVIAYVDTGTASTSRLLAFIDTTPSGGAIAFTPNGSDVLVTVPADGLFTI